MSRRKARMIVLETLYQLDVADGDIDDIITAQAETRKLKQDAKDFILKLVNGVWKHRDEIDMLIGANAENWSIDRITAIDKNILRLASFELLYCNDIPFKVVIDEAVELGKIYGTEDSTAFINGILDKMARNINSRKKEVSEALPA
ncbi:MAG: transcription antitermination factor NusB [Deltaproteobacteria bacterium]|nr:transcription antitermination factor NusB [Deltaproteobacteria bacterium]